MVKKFIRYIVLLFAIFTVGLLLFVYTQRERIVQHFVSEVNQYLLTPIKVDKISLTWLEQFPHVGITLDQVYVQGRFPQAEQPLLKAQQLYFAFNLWQLLHGHYVINRVHLKQAEVHIDIRKKGNNYDVFRSPETTEADQPLQFKLKHLLLSEVFVAYTDEAMRQQHQFQAAHAQANLQIDGRLYTMAVEGKMLCQGIGLDQETYFKNKQLQLKARLDYHQDKNLLTVHPSSLQLGNGHFSVEGQLDHTADTYLDMSVNGKNTDLQTLISLLPQQTAQQFSAYRSEGKAYFEGRIQGILSERHAPRVQLQFGCSQASLYHPGYQKKLENISLTGSFTNGARQIPSTYALSVKDIEATLDGRPVRGSFVIRNFQEYFLTCHAATELDASALLAFYPIPEITTASGLLKADFSIEGSLKDLQQPQAYQQDKVKSKGSILLQDLQLQLKQHHLPLLGWNGRLQFRNNNLALHEVSGYVGNSHFSLNGLFRNALAYLLTDQQYLSIEADLHSNLLDIDELLSDQLSLEVAATQPPAGNANLNWQTTLEKQPYQFHLDPKLILDFSCQIDRLKFRRLRATQLQGALHIRNQVATVKNLAITTAGGRVEASGSVQEHSQHIALKAAIDVNQVSVDSIFYIFEEFDQDFITSDQIKGHADANMQWKMHFDKALHLDYPSLEVDVLATLKQGELNNFEPMQRLGRFVEEQSLSRLRFAEMRNHIRIAHETIYIPPMLVSSNVTELTIQGTHTFSHQIDYRFALPLNTFSIRSAAARERSAQRARSFGEIAESDAKPTMLFLKAQGTTDDFKIAYDLEAAREKLRDDLQDEKKELKDVIKNKGRRNASKVALEEEYFEFEHE